METLKNELKQFQERAMNLLVVRSNNAFDKYPDLKMIQWTQTTPLWNDGEACTFGMNDIYFVFQEHIDRYLEEEGDDDIENMILEDYCSWRPEQGDLQGFAHDLESVASMWEMIFDTNKQITITREGVTTQDYEEGY